jgi:ribonuclease HII
MARQQRRSAPANYERLLWASGLRYVAGVDEAGRGAWAGPLVAAAVIMPPRPRVSGVVDSKLLTAKRRQELFARITSVALAWAVAVVTVEHIAQLKVGKAVRRAMLDTLAQLQPPPQYVLIDGRDLPELSIPALAIPDGDARCYSIAAASIVAKVWRDRLMEELDRQFPAYGFARHKGYGTREHWQALCEHGPCAAHRLGFAPLQALEQSVLGLSGPAQEDDGGL